jgi:hypothetical protein
VYWSAVKNMTAAASSRALPGKSNSRRRFVNVLGVAPSVLGLKVKKNARDVAAITGRLIQKHHLHLCQIIILISIVLVELGGKPTHVALSTNIPPNSGPAIAPTVYLVLSVMIEISDRD